MADFEEVLERYGAGSEPLCDSRNLFAKIANSSKLSFPVTAAAVVAPLGGRGPSLVVTSTSEEDAGSHVGLGTTCCVSGPASSS